MVMIERALIADVTRRRAMSMSFDGACAVDAGALRGPASYTGGESRHDVPQTRALYLTKSTK